MKDYKHVAFLCGYFNLPEQYGQTSFLTEGWKEIVYDDGMIEEYKKFFYHELVEFCMRGSCSGCVHSYRYDMQQPVTLSLGEGESPYSFFLKNVTVYIMPYAMLMYSIEIEQETDDLNQITSVMSVLRSVMCYDKVKHGAFIDAAINPIMDLYRWFHKTENVSFNQLIENGNKLKVFQVVNSVSAVSLDEVEKDVLLFELGTLSRVGSYAKHEDNGISPSYLEEVLHKSKISFYNNWSALSLMDTFTILSFKAPGWLLNNWTDTYFRLIYIHSLFLKFYLFRLNIRFRKNLSDISQLEDELVSFESAYCFHKISYNFLPLAIYKSIDSGLEISEERSQLYHLIDVENQRREKRNDRKVNRFLIFLTLLTMLSTLWDSSCLFNELYPYTEYVGSTIAGYKIVVSALSLVIIVAIIVIFNKRK